MQVATLFSESAKLLGASMDGGGNSTVMDGTKYCMKPEAPADDGYETCLDAMYGNMGGGVGGHHGYDQGMRPGLVSPHQHHQQGMNHGHGHSNNNMRPSSGGMNNLRKMDHYGGANNHNDPYSFVDEMSSVDYNMCNARGNQVNPPSQPKKRGRRKKSDPRNNEFSNNDKAVVTKTLEDKMDAKERKRQDRFNGLSEEEVSQRTLPDHLAPNLDIIMVGINPGMFAAYKGHHYAGPGNHFWKCLYLSGLVPEPFTADDDFNLLNYGIGFTNMVARPTKGSADLTRREIKQGSQILLEKLQKFRPKIAVFNGKLIYEVFSGKKDFPFGRQSEFVDGTNTYIWVMPSSSARCAQLPRAADKVPFYMALKKFRDYLNGLISEIDESEIVFHEPKSSAKPITNGIDKDLSKPSDSSDGILGNGGLESPVKKKRGRPRKGMEKNKDPADPSNKAAKILKNGNKDSVANLDGEPPRKRRGRPKKIKPEDGVAGASGNQGNQKRTSADGFDRNPGLGQKASSVSSGYSTGTTGSSTSSEDRCRREENGSLSNNGLSPSHHSFTTQSDLSSEISAAISCGSCPPSPANTNNGNSNSTNNNNNQTETVFDSLSLPRNNPGNMDLKGMRNGQTAQQDLNTYPPPSAMMDTHSREPQSSYPSHPPHYQPYDNRFSNHVSNRSQNFIPQNSSSRDDEQQSMQTPAYQQAPPQPPQPPPQPQPQQSQQSYEQKCLDITTKSLSGLESLVDQIPSIGDTDGAGPSHHHLAGSEHAQSILASSGQGGFGGATETSPFLPYGHHVPPPPSTYASAHHYASSPYYAPTDIGSSFPYFGHYPSYGAGQYSAGPPNSLTPSPYGNPASYSASSGYPAPGSYMQGHSMPGGAPSAGMSPSAPPGRYPQRPFHLRQDGMDLGALGFGGF